MKFSLEYEVDSNIMIDEEFTYNEKDKTFIFIPDKNKILSSIKIIIKVQESERVKAVFELNTETRIHFLNIEIDNAITEDLNNEFRILESFFGFPIATLRKIYWDKPKQEFIPETEEEIKRMKESKLIGMDWGKSYKDDTFLTKDVFFDALKNRNKYSDLTIPKAFFREGMNDFKNFKYIDAYYNFYFILEDLYGDGKSKNEAIEAEFKQSDEFKLCVQYMIDEINNGSDKRHFTNLSVYLNMYRKNFDVDGLIFLIVRMRGQLHHYTRKSTKPQGTPFNHSKYESLAYLLYGIVVRAILHKTMLINTQK